MLVATAHSIPLGSPVRSRCPPSFAVATIASSFAGGSQQLKLSGTEHLHVDRFDHSVASVAHSLGQK